MAAEVGAVGVVTALVQAGADCTVMAHAAFITPLIVAAAAGEDEMVSLSCWPSLAFSPSCLLLASPRLLSPHAAFSMTFDRSLLPSQVSLLLAITNDIDAIHADKSAMSALMAAASNGSVAIVQKVLDAASKLLRPFLAFSLTCSLTFHGLP